MPIGTDIFGYSKVLEVAESATFWQDYQGLKWIKFSSKSLDITTLLETLLFSINHHRMIFNFCHMISPPAGISDND
jgi:hypothetical protein